MVERERERESQVDQVREKVPKITAPNSIRMSPIMCCCGNWIPPNYWSRAYYNVNITTISFFLIFQPQKSTEKKCERIKLYLLDYTFYWIITLIACWQVYVHVCSVPDSNEFHFSIRNLLFTKKNMAGIVIQVRRFLSFRV